jgi:tetratricopeptide (TPR) repeat protein
MPAGYQEKSKLLLKAYQLRKAAWNDMVQKNYDPAAANLQQAIILTARCYGENSRLLLPLYLDLASVAEAANNHSQETYALNSCLKLDPTRLDTSIRLALTKLQQGNTKEAMTAGKYALNCAPQDPRTHILMSLLLTKMGRTNLAVQERSEARRLYKNLPQIKPPANEQSAPAEQTKTIPTEQIKSAAQKTTQQLPDDSNYDTNIDLELP